jgi:type VI secretion system protein ImpA
MPPITLDLDALTRPLEAPDGPAGPRLPGQDLDKLNRDRKEVDAEPPYVAGKPADWDAIIDDSQRLLRTTSKDLMLGGRLLEALTKKHDFAGTRSGLQLLERLVSDCWDRMHPAVNDGDLEPREAVLRWLDDPSGGSFFLNTLRQTPLFRGPTPQSWENWNQMRQAGGGQESKFFDDARQVPADDLRSANENLSAALEVLERLVSRLKAPDRLGPQAQPLARIRGVLQDCAETSRAVIKVVLPSSDPLVPGAEEAREETQGVAPASRGREYWYARLREAADQLSLMEPHSPIPYLIRRAAELGEKPFPEMIKSFVRDDNLLRELRRELGILDEPAQ